MSGDFENSYFEFLPAEILVHILSYIETIDLLQFCDLYKCHYFCRDSGVVKNVNLYKRYAIHDLKQLTALFKLDFVTVLNVNCLYWVSAQDLRKFVSKMPNLEHLYALKTSLALEDQDVEVYNKTKVTKLAVTITNSSFYHTKVVTLHTLCLDMSSSSKGHFEPTAIIWKFPNIKRLWLEMQEGRQQYLTLTAFVNGISEKIFCKVNAPIPPINYCYMGLERYYNERRLNQPHVVCCERIELADVFQTEREIYEVATAPWKVLYELHSSKPYGPADAKRIFMNERGLDEVDFQELNFTHYGPVCSNSVLQAARNILKKPTATHLTRLCIMMCLLQYVDTSSTPMVHEDTVTFKRKRVGVGNADVDNSDIKELFENLPFLEYLEIYFCEKTTLPVAAAISAYPLIANLKFLKYLTLEIPVTIDGSFLIEVLKNCTLLESLKITAVKQHEKLNFHINQALQSAQSLKDFRYENHRVQMDKLIESLCNIKSNKLERLMVVCKEIDKFSSGPLRNLLNYNTQLVFLFMIIEQGTELFLKKVQKTLNEYKKRNPANVYLIKKKNEFAQTGFPVPDVHFLEMVQPESVVANLNAYEQFMTF